MKQPQQAKYIGSNPLYKDETALVRDSDTPGVYMVQFDSRERHEVLAHNWHPFPATDWQYTHTECNHCLEPMNGKDPTWSGCCSSSCARVFYD